MSKRKINLEKILMNIIFSDMGNISITYDSRGKRQILLAMKEACKQALELAIENTGFIETTSEKLNSEDYAPFIIADDDTIWTIHKQSIRNTLNQIE